MSDNEERELMDEQQRRKALRGCWTFFLVLAVCIGPFLLAWGWYFLGQPSLGDETTNYGDLLDPPVTLENVELDVVTAREESPRLPAFAERNWTLLYVSGEGCGAECREALWGTRQIRLALGRDMGRVQRVLLEPGRVSDAAFYQDEHEDLRVLDLDDPAAGEFLRQLQVADTPQPRDGGLLYLIDPLGNLIMTYPPGFDPDGLMDDLEVLLQASQVG